ncbi:anti-sigma factor family protein [Streptomyces cellulosae]|uniref:anti-sigma factor family protein n=1 Tax=Streptomyces cellulosae TaxID=1968 RepID=UPI0004C4A91A|nr:membrane protein [Streptomyces cellulosae]
MTTTTGTDGHPDVAEISDLTEGLLPPSRTADVRRHLDECELCADVYASLGEIRGLLGTLPGPPRMPAEVAGRIDAALAAELLLHATAPDDVDAQASVATTAQSLSSTETHTDTDDRAYVSRETSAMDRPAGHARVSTAGPGRKERKKGNRRRVAVLGTVFTVAAVGFGSVMLSSLNDGNPSGPEARGQQSTSADTFSQGTLEKQVSDLLATSKRPRSHSLGGQSLPGSDQPRILQDPTVPDCVQRGTGRTDPALGTKPGTYKGTKAMLVVLPAPSGGTGVTAYIMDATCVADASVGKAKVLLKQSYQQP